MQTNEYRDLTLKRPRRSIGVLILKIVIPMVILATGAAAGLYLKEGEPKVRKTRPRASLPMVDVMTIQPERVTMDVSAMGVVIPKQAVEIKSQVSGMIDWVSNAFEPGQVVEKGDVILKIDSRDYAIAIRRSKGDVAAAKAKLDLEKGNQAVAKEELAFIQKTAPKAVTDPSLALRVPQLAQAEVALDLAKAALEQAKLNFSRTTIRAPFSGMITERLVNMGSYAGNQSHLVTLVSVDEYWIEAAVPLDRLAHLDLGQSDGVPVRILSSGSGGVWEGRTVRLTGTFTPSTRMAKLLVTVTDPLGLKTKKATVPLMLGDYVQVEIQGRTLDHVIALPRYALREDNVVWIADEGRLTLRPVEIAWKNSAKIFVSSGLTGDEQVILSDLVTPVEGMALQIATAKEDDVPDKKRPGAGTTDPSSLATVTANPVINSAEDQPLQ